jgi:hypothetical protein
LISLHFLVDLSSFFWRQVTLVQVLKKWPARQALIFCPTISLAMETRDYLVKNLGEEVGLLHGAYHDGTNSRIWNRFSQYHGLPKSKRLRVVVSTALAELVPFAIQPSFFFSCLSQGLDHPYLDLVIQFGPCNNPNELVQRVGRAARALFLFGLFIMIAGNNQTYLNKADDDLKRSFFFNHISCPVCLFLRPVSWLRLIAFMGFFALTSTKSIPSFFRSNDASCAARTVTPNSSEVWWTTRCFHPHRPFLPLLLLWPSLFLHLIRAPTPTLIEST